MAKRAWSMAAVATMALASLPFIAPFHGRNVQMRQTSQVAHTPAGPVPIAFRYALADPPYRIAPSGLSSPK
jgi:hypothetical protein